MVGGDNGSGADNQQERLQCRKEVSVKKVPERIGYYLAGYADGKGRFDVSLRRRESEPTPDVSLCFIVYQREKVILSLFKRHLGCGTVRHRGDGIWCYEVKNLTAILNNIIPFFKKYNFLSMSKKREFSKFCKIAKLLAQNTHLTEEGRQQVLRLRKEMTWGGKLSCVKDKTAFHNAESSETIRQTLDINEVKG